MKSIADFIEGKIVRLEVTDEVSFSRGGAAHPALGACEGTLIGPGGEAQLYKGGMTVGGTSFAYEQIERVEISPAEAGQRKVAIVLPEQTILLHSSDTGGEVVHATLRWIGHTILRRKIA
jgi:hypothetical protein